MERYNILPADTYIVINKSIINNEDRKILNMLYQPIIGPLPIMLYFSLWSDLDKLELISEEYTHHHLVTNMHLSLNEIVDARSKLEAIGLLKTYFREGAINNYVYELYSPLSEEIVFRGILLDDLSKYNNKFIAILLGSFIFGILHRDLISMIYAFIFGIVTGIVYLKDRNLTNCILIHASGNFIVLLLTGYNIYILLLSFILLIISVFIIKRDYLLK